MKALVIAPLDASAQRLKDTVRRALSDIGVEVVTADSLATSGAEWASAVNRAIASVELVIADISRDNPNVYYEVGFAHALRKPTILLVSDDAQPRIPSDLTGLYYKTYDPNNLRDLGEYLKRTAESHFQRRHDGE